MNDTPRNTQTHDNTGAAAPVDAPGLSPLPGEPGLPDFTGRPKSRLSVKALLAIALLLMTVISSGVLAVRRMTENLHRSQMSQPTLARDKPAAASVEPPRLDLSESSPPAQGAASAPLIPALRPLPQDSTADPDPIAVHGTPTAAAATPGTSPPAPEDAPVLLLTSRIATPAPAAKGQADRLDTAEAGGFGDEGTAAAPSGAARSADALSATRRNLQDYQRRLQGLLSQLTQSAAVASKATEPSSANTGMSGWGPGSAPNPGQHGSAWPSLAPASAGPAIAGPASAGPSSADLAALAPTALDPAGVGPTRLEPHVASSPRTHAKLLGDRSLTLPQGTAFTCALKTRVISATSGLIGCVLQHNLYGDDGRVVLAERGSHLDGEYRATSVKPGTVRIPVLWTRLRTPLGVTVELQSPGTGQLGESGIDGYVDNRWGARIGAAMLLSLIDDSVKLIIQNQTQEHQADTVVLPSTTANSSKLAEKVLDSTINIPPLIYQNQGGIVGIYVARDIDFSSVYALEPLQRAASSALHP